MKKQFFIFINTLLPTLIIGQNEIKSLEDRIISQKAKVNIETAYYTDSLQKFKKLFYTIEYDKSGNIIEYKNYLANGYTVSTKILLEYNSKNILKKKTLCLDSLCNHHTIEVYNEKGNILKASFYDQAGNLTSSDEAKYNSKGNKTETTIIYASKNFAKNICSYNDKDSLIQTVTKDNEGKITYDSKNPETVSNNFGFSPSIPTYNKLKDKKEYYNNGKLKSIETFDSQNNLLRRNTYQYDINGNRTVHILESLEGNSFFKTIVIQKFNQKSLVTSRQIVGKSERTDIVFDYTFFK